MSCTGNTLWYVCTKGNFRGCCSVDPCTTGVCPDDSGDGSSGDGSSGDGDGGATTSSPESPPSQATTKTTTSSPAATAKTTASESSSSSSEPTTQSTPSPSPSPSQSSSLPPTQTITAFAETNGTTTTTTTTPPPGNPSDTSLESPVSAYNRKAVIGGAVAGGLVGLVLLLLGVFWLVRRSRKRRNRWFRVLQWHGPQYQHENGNEKGGGSDGGYNDGDRENAGVAPCAESKGNADDRGEENVQGPVPYNINTTQDTKHHTTPSTTAETPISALSSTTRLLARTPPSLSSSPEKQQPHSRLTPGSIFITPPPPPPPLLRTLEPIPSSPSSPLTLIPPTTTKPTPELGDTGFYRQRAELPTDSERELINIPQGGRMHRQRAQSQSHIHPAEREIKGKTHIITPDGVVLASNFERSPGCRDYVTSFMQCYDGDADADGRGDGGLGLKGLGLGIEFQDELPAYYPVMQADIKMENDKDDKVKEQEKERHADDMGGAKGV